jgi:hypothetical protein
MAYTRGDSKKIIVGAAALFIGDYSLEWYGDVPGYKFSATSASTAGLPSFVQGTSFRDTLSESSGDAAYWANIGYTMNGLEMQFQPDFGEVQVDQLLDVARLFKQGMSVSLVTAFAEASLENLVTAIAADDADLSGSSTTSTGETLELMSGDIGDVPLERAIVAIGPGTGDPNASKERVYVANRALSIENVTVSAKRDTPSMFEVTFRLLSAANGSYGKIVDRTV